MADLYSSIAHAAVVGREAGEESNLDLRGAVIQAIVADPGQVEQILAVAVSLAPEEKERLIAAATGAFPGFEQRILRGATMRPSPPRQSIAPTPVPTPAPTPTPVTYVPPQTAQTRGAETQSSTPGNSRSRAIYRRGPYVDFGAGLTLVQDSDLDTPLLPGVTGVLTTDAGFDLNGAVGYRMGNGIRGDVELAYRRNALDTLSLTAFGITITGDIAGTMTVFSTLVNGYYDFAFDRGLFVPYIGGGVGVAFVNLELDSTGFDDTETVFAYQLAAGAKIPISDKVSARIGYKFFATANPTFGTVEAEYVAHNVEVGVVYDF